MTEPLPLGNSGYARISPLQWVICVIAAIGFAFDIYELLMLPLILRPALMELGGLRPGTPEFSHWFGLLFYLPALAGGIFGLLGGFLTDRLGRRRVLTWSILLYACSAFLAGFSTSLWMLLVLRCTTFIGVCVEFVAAVAWLAELFPHPKQRERVLGYTQAFSSLGGIMVAWANWSAIKLGASLPAIAVPDCIGLGQIAEPHAAWRYTLMSGLIPAIPLILVRPFLPESPVWKQKRQTGTLRRPSIAELFAPGLRKTTIVTTIMFACSLGAAFGALQQMPQIVPGTPQVQQRIKDEIAKLPPPKATASAATRPATVLSTQTATAVSKPASPSPQVKAKTGEIIQEAAASATKIQEYGGLLGRVILAILAVQIVSRRKLIRIFQIPGLIIIPIVFGYVATRDYNGLQIGMFLAGMVTVAQLSFWGNYLPRVYPTHLRGTGESFAANVGGRMIGTCFAFITAQLAAAYTPQGANPVTAAHYWSWTAAGVGLFVYLVGFVASFFLPEPGQEDIDQHSTGEANVQSRLPSHS